MPHSLQGDLAAFPAVAVARASRDAVYRAVWRWHFYAGLLCLPFLILLAATGSIYLFKDEINGSLFAYRTVVAAQAKAPLGADRLIFHASQAVPDGRPLSFVEPSGPTGSALVTMSEAGRKILVYLNPYDGSVLDRVASDDEFMMVVRRLHSLAYFGPVANGLVEIVAGFAVILVVTGLYLWWPRGQSGGVVSLREAPARRVWWRDLHAVTGMIAGAGLLFLALTGLPWSVWWGKELRTWSNAAGLGQPRGLWADKPVSNVPMQEMLTTAGWAMQDAPVPKSAPVSAAGIGTDRAVAILHDLGMPRGFELSLPVGETGVFAAASYPHDVTRQRLVSLDQYTGAPLVDVRFSDLGGVAQAIQYGIGIHKGEHFGRVNQFAMLAFCLATILLAVTAAVMWWKRRPAGRIGVPPWPRERRTVATVTLIVLALGALFPLTGLVVLGMLTLDMAVQLLRRRPNAARALGLAAVGTLAVIAEADLAHAQGRTETLEEVSVVGEGQGPGSPRNAGRAVSPARAAPTAFAPVSAPPPTEEPVGQVVTSIGREGVIDNRPATTVADILRESPGVTVRQGNGPRDIVVSIRGNNARAGGVLRNFIVLEDGFPVTQADGTSRFDLVDPRAYQRIDVFRGPQSALFGNFATGGALSFLTRRGAEIDGVEYGVDAGSFGYLNNYATFGGVSGPFEYSLFTSDTRGNGFAGHSSYNTQTINFLGTYAPTPDDRFTLKIINNEVFAELPARSSLNQYRINPFQRGCEAAATAAPGCTTFNLFLNGRNGARVPVTADEGGFQRGDRRTIIGGRWEHDFDAFTTWRTQLVFDDRNISQPFYTTSGRGDFPGFNFLTDVTRRGDLFGLPATGYVALAYNTLDSHSLTYNRAPYLGPRLGGLIADLDATQANLGGRARIELELAPQWTAVAGISAEDTTIKGRNFAYAYPLAGGVTTTLATLDRGFLNVAPELALVYRPDPAWQFRGRVATGYGTPSASNLTVTSAGLPGNNADLKAQENLGFDLGTDWTPLPDVRFSLTGFYEFFRNELVSQSPGAGLLTYFFNAPASEHRGVEFGADWAFAPGWRATAAYTFDDQIYTEYVEQLSAGSRTARFDRDGNRIPGVPAHQLLARLGYEQATGPFAGAGGYVETIVQDDFFLDNANLLKAPGYGIVNLNLHYTTALTGYAKRLNLFIEARNVFDRTYIASAQNLANSISPTTGVQNGASVLAGTTGSVFAGAPRNFVGGMRLSF